MHIELEQFAGPLDLLLSLIEEEKLDISAISLARVADHYIEYINQYPDSPLETLLHFLEIGSRLVVLKTRLLLPHFAEEDENEDELVAHLKQYREYRVLTKRLNDLWRKKQNALYTVRVSETFHAGAMQEVETRISQKILHAAFARIAKKLAAAAPLKIAIGRRIFNLYERIAAIQKYLSEAKRALFSEFIETRHKHEIIVNFIAILELAKSRSICISQRVLWGDIIIEKLYGTEKRN